MAANIAHSQSARPANMPIAVQARQTVDDGLQFHLRPPSCLHDRHDLKMPIGEKAVSP